MLQDRISNPEPLTYESGAKQKQMTHFYNAFAGFFSFEKIKFVIL